MAFKLKDGSGVEHEYTKEKLKIPSTAEGEFEVFTKGEVQDEKTVTITENGTTEVTPDTGYGSVKKVGLTVDVPTTTDYKELANLPSINGVELAQGLTSVDIGVYGDGNEPPYPVQKVNGETGEVETTLIVTGEYDSETGNVEASHSFEQIKAAAQAGKSCYLRFDGAESTYLLGPYDVENDCFSGVSVGVGDDLYVASAYHNEGNYWKVTERSFSTPGLVKIQINSTGEITASKTYNEMCDEALNRLLRGDPNFYAAVIDATDGQGTLLPFFRTNLARGDSIIFSNTFTKEGVTKCVTATCTSGNVWTVTKTPTENLVRLYAGATPTMPFSDILSALSDGAVVATDYLYFGLVYDTYDDVAETITFRGVGRNANRTFTLHSDNTWTSAEENTSSFVNLTETEGVVSADRTFSQIQQSLASGKNILVKNDGYILNLIYATAGEMDFNLLTLDESGEVLFHRSATVTSDDKWTFVETFKRLG